MTESKRRMEQNKPPIGRAEQLVRHQWRCKLLPHRKWQSTAPTPGDWTYIGFKDSSNDVNSRVEYTTIRYAGENRNRLYGAIHLEGASPTIVGNTIEDSFAYGIWYDVNSEPVLENNTFGNNREGDVVAAE